MRLGVVGSGPAGYYAAIRVRQKLPNAFIDMYEKLPVPYGLVRYGVAPDHPEVKNCQDRFEEVAPQSHGLFHYVGNVSIGDQINISNLKQHYDALLFAYGASTDRLLGIPGEASTHGIYSARGFVGWYNGLPEFAGLAPDLDAEHAVVIGNGNVALDIARILLTDVDALRKTDISDSALDTLSKSRVKKVTIAGRRGPMQAAFTIKELRELVNLPACAFHADKQELIPSAGWISKLPRLEQRKYRFAKLLTEGVLEGDKQCTLRSMISPDAFLSSNNDGNLSHIRFRHNVFEDDSSRFVASAKVKPTTETEDVETQVAFRSIGYKAEPINGLRDDLGIEFDRAKGIIPNDGFGRALKSSNAEESDGDNSAPGCYCAGWVKNGPTGVIATTMEDAFATADAMIQDWNSGRQMLRECHPDDDNMSGWEALRGGLLEDDPAINEFATWRDWKAIDWFEKQLGKENGGKPRSKITDVAEMMRHAQTVRNMQPACEQHNEIMGEREIAR
ncbi:MAG: hypothetical protein Q9159_002943 [Coniocarpon cinnabarinum]